MPLPNGITDTEFVEAVEAACQLLAPSFVFGYMGVEDIKQQAAVFALQALKSGKYDPAQSLRAFLYTHIKNRLINFKGDLWRRNDPPCMKCHGGQKCSDGARRTAGATRVSSLRNNAKSGLMRPVDLGSVAESHTESVVEAKAEGNELSSLIDQELPVELRADYLRMLDGVSLPKPTRTRVQRAVATSSTARATLCRSCGRKTKSEAGPGRDDPGPEAEERGEGSTAFFRGAERSRGNV